MIFFEGNINNNKTTTNNNIEGKQEKIERNRKEFSEDVQRTQKEATIFNDHKPQLCAFPLQFRLNNCRRS